MTKPVQTEQQNLDRMLQALSAVQTIGQVRDALLAFPDVATDAVAALLNMPPIRGLLTLNQVRPGKHASEVAMARHNLIRRAGYLISAARRLTTAARSGRLIEATTKERAFLAQHLDAVAKRTLAAKQVAREAQAQTKRIERINVTNGVPGRPADQGLLGWYTTLDDRTSPECRRAHGLNFDPRQIPPIGFPGAVHPYCRCKAGPPHRSADRVEYLQTPTTAEVAAARPAIGSWRISGGIV